MEYIEISNIAHNNKHEKYKNAQLYTKTILQKII